MEFALLVVMGIVLGVLTRFWWVARKEYKMLERWGDDIVKWTMWRDFYKDDAPEPYLPEDVKRYAIKLFPPIETD